VQRTIHRGRYRNGHPTPGGEPFDIAEGERSIVEQYVAAIGGARRSIYLENHSVEVPEIIACLRAALTRGVEVVLLMPENPDTAAPTASSQPELRAFLDAWGEWEDWENFTLAGIAGVGDDGTRKPVYVHAKLIVVDDAWASIGSCNLHRASLFGNAEMNVSCWDPAVVRGLRCELLAEHLGEDTARLDDRSALRRFRQIAQENRRLWQDGHAAWQGNAFSVNPATCGK